MKLTMLLVRLFAGLAFVFSVACHADVVSDWNAKACDVVVNAKLDPPHATYRAMAIVQTSVYEAANAVSRRYRASELKLDAPRGASLDAAVAAANRAALLKLVPSQQAAIDAAYNEALGKIADGAAKSAGIAVGEKAAAAVLAARDGDVPGSEAYRPVTTAGVYVPTTLPLSSHWPQRKPWLLKSVDQFRPGPPPALTSEIWARDYNEIKAIGAKNSTTRAAEQTAIARFWEATLPPIYAGVVQSLANQPGRDLTQNARLFAAAMQAIDDALIAVFDAKYHYNFWRPITAIRNGDIDGNDATERDPSWQPFISTPMHPEYPCAHCIASGALGTVLKAEIGAGPTPTLSTTSTTAQNAVRNWTNVEDFIHEVANARIYDGVH